MTDSPELAAIRINDIEWRGIEKSFTDIARQAIDDRRTLLRMLDEARHDWPDDEFRTVPYIAKATSKRKQRIAEPHRRKAKT